MTTSAKSAKSAKTPLWHLVPKPPPYREGRGFGTSSIEGSAKSTCESKCRITRRAVLLAVVLVAMRVCHRTLRMLAKWADRLRV
jgi:hypothetical protein